MNNNFNDWTISPELYNWILDHLSPSKTILELGSGAGTQMLSKYYKMISIEHNKDFVGKYESIYIHAPIKDGYYDLPKEIPYKYHLLLIDGPPGTWKRSKLLDHLSKFDLSNINIIVDDTNRGDEKLLAVALTEKLGRKTKFIDCGRKQFCVIYKPGYDIENEGV